MHIQKHIFFSVGQYQLAEGKMLVSWMHTTQKELRWNVSIHSFLLSLQFSPNFCMCLSMLLPQNHSHSERLDWMKQGGCQSPFLSQHHVHCLSLRTVTHPVLPPAGDKRPPHHRGGMTLLSGMLKILDLPTPVCEFKSPLLETGLRLQLMTPRCRGSAHWWAGGLRHCASWVLHFSHNWRFLFIPSFPPKPLL